MSGLLLILAYPPFGVPLFAAVALVPLALVVRPEGQSTAAMAAGAGWAGAFFGVQLLWIASALESQTRLYFAAYLSIVAVLVLIGMALATAAWRLGRFGVAPALAFAIALVGTEWLRSHLGPLAFPWLGVGTTIGSTPALLAPAAWLGERGLTFGMALAGGLLATWVHAVRAGRVASATPRAGFGYPVLGLAVLAAGWGGWARASGSVHAGLGNVHLGVVTTAFGAEGQIGAEERLLWLEAVLNQAATAGPLEVDAVVAPEGMLPVLLERRPDFVRRIAALAERSDAAIALGAYGATDGSVFNSTFLIDADGIVARSDKRHRVPVIESGFGSGRYRVLTAGDLPLGPFVCFESLFSGVARDLANAGAELLLNPTSESWFLSGGRWAALQHVEHLRMRSAEVGRAAVRPANDGTSMVLDPDGRITWQSEAPGLERVVVRREATQSVFARVGDVLGLLCGATVLLVLLLAGWARRVGKR